MFAAYATLEAQEDPAVARFRSFDAASTLLLALSEQHPLAIFLEDLHWADPATLSLLEFVGGRMRNAKILVIGTCRESELAQEHSLTETLNLIRLAANEDFGDCRFAC